MAVFTRPPKAEPVLGQNRLVANLLGINDRDSAIARQRVEARKSG